MRETKKRKIVHVQIGENHWYFGSVAAVFQQFGPAVLGTNYSSLVRNLWKMRKDKPSGTIEYFTDECVIREGEIVTAPKSEPQKG